MKLIIMEEGMKKIGNYCEGGRKGCSVRWVEVYFKDCLCNLKDELSFSFGIISLLCWAFAEIPQIITNFINKSANGVSLSFLFTWIIGDVFNLVGCILEPATLPTQFYTALLYTTTTVILVLQCLYYEYFLCWWKCRQIQANPATTNETKVASAAKPKNTLVPNSPVVQVPHKKDFYYRSARSMAGSDTPPFECYIKARSGPSAMKLDTEDYPSSEDDADIPSTISGKRPFTSQPRSIPCPKGAYYGTFLAAYLPRGKALVTGATLTLSTGRRLLQNERVEHEAYGQWLGWLMAAIYMGGRIPQIWLNIKRGSVEGLNPLMFIFALVANATYVASILLRSTEWEKIQANMPWLLDAVVCVLLDLFIILQYIYYRYMMKTKRRHAHDFYVNANKSLIS